MQFQLIIWLRLSTLSIISKVWNPCKTEQVVFFNVLNNPLVCGQSRVKLYCFNLFVQHTCCLFLARCSRFLEFIQLTGQKCLFVSLIFRAFVLNKQKHHLIISTFAYSVAIHCDGKVSSGVSSSLLVVANRVYIQNTEKKTQQQTAALLNGLVNFNVVTVKLLRNIILVDCSFHFSGHISMNHIETSFTFYKFAC